MSPMLKSSCPKPLVVTTGEPAGIGPDIALALQDRIEAPLVLLGDYNLLCERAGLLGFKKPPLWQEGERFGVIDVPLLALVRQACQILRMPCMSCLFWMKPSKAPCRKV